MPFLPGLRKRVYNPGLDELFTWYEQEPRPGFTKATVSAWRAALEARGLESASINVRITAVGKLAVEAADNGLLAAGIPRVKGAKSKGVHVGTVDSTVPLAVFTRSAAKSDKPRQRK
jgi:hypothetical protein